MATWKRNVSFVTLLLTLLVMAVAGTGTLAQQEPDTDSNAKPPLIDGAPADAPPFVVSPELQQPSATTAPTIDVWYGLNQAFGARLSRRSDPQKWVNIPGRVTPKAGVSVNYRLNGGPSVPLSLGPDNRRLAQTGDFNIELDYTDLKPGLNLVVISAEGAGGKTQQTVTITYNSAAAWTPGVYTFNWASVSQINALGQVVDGHWVLDGNSVRPTVFDYDRLLALGDMSWRDYTVTVPITVYSVDPSGYFGPSNGPGVGLITRWNGHYDDGDGETPLTGWSRLGGLAWYRWKQSNGVYTEGFQLVGNNNHLRGSNSKKLEIGETYNFKLNLVSSGTPGVAANYKFKVWPAAAPEPATWDIEASGQKDEPSGGSVVLVAHHVDVRFGPVVVELASTRPQPTLNVTTTGAGAGSVTTSPPGPTFRFGEDVLLTASPNAGSVFGNWSGGLAGTDNPAWIELFENKTVSAVFNKHTQTTYKVSVTANGSGTVTKSPPKENYSHGEKVTLTAQPEPGHYFANWSGSVTGSTNPVTITVDRNMTIVGNFASTPLFTLDVTVEGEGQVTWSPDKTTFSDGETVTLTATPAGGSQFVGWSGDALDLTNPLTLIMDGNKSIIATFTEPGYSTYLPSVIGE